MVRKLLESYRSIQYKICGRSRNGALSEGDLCTHDPFEDEINHGDVVHPCVRYIPKGYEGHCWWMVYTPYYAANDKTENPILCYAESNDPTPPTRWKVYCQVQGQPSIGYNSDPTLLYDDGKLFVFWRENETKRCINNGCFRATFGGIVDHGTITNVFGPVVETKDSEYDPETSPTFLKSNKGTYRCLAMSLTFHSKVVKHLPAPMRNSINYITLVTDLLGLWSQQKHHGIAQWSCSTIDGKYHLDKTVRFKNQNFLYRPWHMDFFEYDEKMYAVVQTNQCNADVCLAESTDGVNFRFFKKPLMTNATCKKVGIYKPCAGVIGDTFYLYYTAQDIDNRKLNKLYLTTMSWEHLQKEIR